MERKDATWLFDPIDCNDDCYDFEIKKREETELVSLGTTHVKGRFNSIKIKLTTSSLKKSFERSSEDSSLSKKKAQDPRTWDWPLLGRGRNAGLRTPDPRPRTHNTSSYPILALCKGTYISIFSSEKFLASSREQCKRSLPYFTLFALRNFSPRSCILQLYTILDVY